MLSPDSAAGLGSARCGQGLYLGDMRYRLNSLVGLCAQLHNANECF